MTIIATVIRVFQAAGEVFRAENVEGPWGRGKTGGSKLLTMLGKYMVLCEHFKTNKHL